ncbi:MAG: hypothetical protein ACRD0S_11970, partial [Acidimicrobiales bacterium]
MRSATVRPFGPLVLVAALAAGAVGLAGCSDEEGDNQSPASAAAGTGAGALAELPVPRTEVSGATWEGGLVVLGGLTPDGAASALVHTFDADENRWKGGRALPVPLHHAGLAVAGDRLYVAGGYSNGPGEGWQAQAGVRSLGPGEASWRDEAP